MLKKSEYPNGLDGFYYALQSESFVQTYHLENPDFECGYYLCGLCSLICGNAILGVKIWSSLSSALLGFSIFILIFVLLKKSDRRFPFSIFGMILSGSLVCVTSLSINYINNQTGLCFLFFYIASLISFFYEKEKSVKSKKVLCIKVISVLAFFLLSILSHKVSLIYALVFTAIFFVSRFLKKKSFSLKLLPLLLLIFAAVFFVLIRQTRRFATAFAFPSLAFMHQNIVNSIGGFGFFGAMEITVFFIASWICVFIFLILRQKIFTEFLLVFAIFFPFWNLDSDMGYRMSVNAVVCGIPLLIYFFDRLLNMVCTKFSNIEKKYCRFEIGIKIVTYVFCATGFAGIFFSTKVYDPNFDPPFAYYKTVAEKIELEDDSLLIAHLGLNHVYTYYNNLRDCLNWIPNFYVPEDKLWRLAFGVNSGRIKNLFPERTDVELEKLVKKIDNQYVLIKERLWQEYLIREDEELVEVFMNWFNPHEIRPDYIRSN